MKGLGVVVFLSLLSVASAQKAQIVQQGTWQPLTNQPPFAGVVVPFLLTDGSILCQEDNNNWGITINTNHWWKLTPDQNGSYVNGTWTRLADMRSDYAPTFYPSAVLEDGRFLLIGGEYNFLDLVNTSKGAIYDPVANAWTNLDPPDGWDHIGDAPSTLLSDGKFLVASNWAGTDAAFDPNTMSWTIKAPSNESFYFEEGWTLLPDGTVMEIDTGRQPEVERYIPWLDQWMDDQPTPVQLTGREYDYEIGPAVLRFDGTILAFGANSNTAIYTPPAMPTDQGSWTIGPPLPNNLGVPDGPACLLPNGNVFFAASPGLGEQGLPTFFFETDGSTITPEPGVPTSDHLNSVFFSMLVLPNGQVMLTNSDRDIEIYSPVGGPQDAWRPTITVVPTIVNAGSDYMIEGTQFNGFSQTNMFGDDMTNATNYPLVRITNVASGHVFYCRTHDHSTMAVATGSLPVSTHFTVPSTIETGPSKLEVVANGIASFSRDINVGSTKTWSGFLPPFDARKIKAGSTVPLRFTVSRATTATGYWASVVNGVAGADHEIGVFAYHAASGIYHLNWQTKGLTPGNYQIKVVLGDGSVHIVSVTLK